jgi:hypothetical protein
VRFSRCWSTFVEELFENTGVKPRPAGRGFALIAMVPKSLSARYPVNEQ